MTGSSHTLALHAPSGDWKELVRTAQQRSAQRTAAAPTHCRVSTRNAPRPGSGHAVEPCARPASYDVHHAARTHRWAAIGRMTNRALHAIRAFVRDALARARQRRQAEELCRALQELDNRTLRDIGFDRSEIESVAAELAGATGLTRIGALQALRGVSNIASSSRTSAISQGYSHVHSDRLFPGC